MKKKKKKVKTPPPKQRPLQNIDDLAYEAKYGELTTEELIYVVEQIKASKPGDNTDLYGLLFILGWAGATQYRELVERFLYYPTNPMVSGMAVTVLFRYWGDDAQRYLNEIKAFVKGVSWDDDDDLRLAAMQCTGDFLRKNPEKELYQLVLDLYKTSNAIVLQAGREKTDESSRAKFWLDVYFTQLARSVGKGWNDLLGKPLTEEFMRGVLAKVEQIIKTLK